MRKEQAIRGRVVPQPHQQITIHQIPKAERDQRAPGESWWVPHAKPSAPRSDEFYAEVARRAASRVNKAEARAYRMKQPKEPPTRLTHCHVCSKPLTANDQRHRVIRCKPCRKSTARIRRAA